MKAGKWSNPYAWACWKIRELEHRIEWTYPPDRDALHQLAAMALMVAADMLHEDLQSCFLTEMTSDGYFCKPEDRFRELLSQGWEPDAAAHQVDFEFGFEEVG